MIGVAAGGWAAEDMLAPRLFSAQAKVDQRAKGGTSSYVKREPVSNVKIYDLECMNMRDKSRQSIDQAGKLGTLKQHSRLRGANVHC